MSSVKNKTGVKSIFNSVEMTRPNSNMFDLSHMVDQSQRMGELMPCMVQETIPGDTFILGGDLVVRVAPMLAPFYGQLEASIHYFYVPNRTTCESFPSIVFPPVEGAVPPAHPYITVDSGLTAAQQRFLDYFGIPPFTGGAGAAQQVNPLPLAAYQKIYDEYYRDENLVPTVPYALTTGSNAIGELATVRLRAFEHDAYTSSLPWTQKGDPVDLPLGSVELNPNWSADNQQPTMPDGFGAPTGNPITGQIIPPRITDSLGTELAFDPNGSLTVGATTINDLRRAEAIQKMLEIDARGGTRYNEGTMAHFGEDIGDATIQRAEYIVGVKTPVVISEVLNQSGEVGGLPQGNMSGHAIAAGGGKAAKYHCSEYGFIIGILSIIPRTQYMWGIPKWAMNNDRYDYYWPSLANIGEEAVKNNEVMAYVATSNETFAYNPRYYQHKYQQSRIAGTFFRGAGLYWHAGRNFSRGSAVPLNRDFIEVDPADFERIFAVQDGSDNLWVKIYNKVMARRLMPVYGTPQL